jgi:hypothetical protein
MPPKNPVRAARQAGRQAVRAAKDTRRETVGAAKTASKVAKIQTRTASKVGKISGTPASTAKPVTKSAAPVSKTSTTSTAKTAPKSGLSGKDLLTYSVKPKATTAKGPSYAPFKSPADQKKSQQMTADDKRRAAEAAKKQQEAASKKASADAAANKKKAAADAKKKQEAAARKKQEAESKKQADAAAVEAQRVKDMFLQPGETRANTSPFASEAKIKEIEAKKKLKEEIEKYKNMFKPKGSPDFTRPEPAEFGPKYKRGGSIKKYQAGGMTVKPPRSVRGPKQSPSDMRQPFSPSQKPVGPGNTARTPKPYRKSKPSTPGSMMRPMKKGGSMKGKNC